MLNMLIAIMGDTFARTIENRDLNSTKTKLELLGDLSANIHQSEAQVNHVDDKIERFLFVVTPDEDECDELNTWEGSISQMSKITEKRISQLETKLEKKLNSIVEQAEQSSKRDIAQDKDLKQQFSQMIKLVRDEIA